MIDKVEAGKTYRLVDEARYLRISADNKDFIKLYKDSLVTIDHVDHGIGYVSNRPVIGNIEYECFELVEDSIDLYNIDKPFGKLDKKTQMALFEAWLDGATVVYRELIMDSFYPTSHPKWWESFTYKLKSAKSEKDIAIENAQRKLKEAQDELEKAKSL